MRPKNVFWIMTDEQRADTIGLEIGGVPVTPHLNRLAARGLRYTQAVTPSPMCVPARTSILAAENPSRTGVWRNRREPGGRVPNQRSVVHRFREAGYRTITVGKQHHALKSSGFETEERIILSEGVDYTAYSDATDEESNLAVRFPGPTPWILAGTFPAQVDKTAEWRIVDRGIAAIEECPAGVPLFLRLSFNAPHTPVVPPPEYLRLFPSDEEAWVAPSAASESCATSDDSGFGFGLAFGGTRPLAPLDESPTWLRLLQEQYADATSLSRDEVATIRRYYVAHCRFVDAMIGRFLDHLEESGLLDDSVVVFCSDHGAHLGEHGLVQKQSFFSESVLVPYLISSPELEPAEVDTPVSLTGLLPTAAALAGVRVDEAEDTEGDGTGQPVVSQMRLNPPKLGFDHRIVMVQDAHLRGVFDIDAPHEQPVLFDLQNDPAEERSCAGESAYREALRRLSAIASTTI